MSRDPFLIAYAYADSERIVVTEENFQPKKERGNRKVPDVCNDLKVTWMDDLTLYKELDFRIT